MGADCNLFLPAGADIEDVATVAAVLMGCEYKLEKPFDEAREGSQAVRLKKGVQSFHCSDTIPSMCVFVFKGNLVDGENGHNCSWHWEGHGRNPSLRMLSMSSTAFWIAVARGLADFFGGEVDYNDCDNKDVNYKVKSKSRKHDDGDAFYNYQRRMTEAKPLTQKDLNKVCRFAAYKGV